MRSIPHPSIASAVQGGNNSFYGARVADYVSRQSVSGHQNLSAGLTIKTRDGDLVTLTSNAFFQFDAFKYNREGVVESENGLILSSRNYMEMTLTSGEMFSFTVNGDLDQAELQDIKDIVKNVDGIIAEMVAGDMATAVEKAMDMGAYDTVSMYTADISLEKQVRTVTEMSSRTGTLEPASQLNPAIEDNTPRLPRMQAFAENYIPESKKESRADRFEKWVDQMTERLQQHADKQLVRSGKALNKLFRHHLEQTEESLDKKTPAYNNLEKMAERISQYIDGIAERLFESAVSNSQR